MFNTTKSMLEHKEEIQKNIDGYRRNDGNYFDKHDLEADGKPIEKPFVPGSLRIAPHSSTAPSWSKMTIMYKVSTRK